MGELNRSKTKVSPEKRREETGGWWRIKTVSCSPMGGSWATTDPLPPFLILICISLHTPLLDSEHRVPLMKVEPERLSSCPQHSGVISSKRDALGGGTGFWSQGPVWGLHPQKSGIEQPPPKWNLCINFVVPRPRDLRSRPCQEKEQEVAGQVHLKWL